MMDGSLGLEIHTHWAVNHHVLCSDWLRHGVMQCANSWPLVILIDSPVARRHGACSAPPAFHVLLPADCDTSEALIFL